MPPPGMLPSTVTTAPFFTPCPATGVPAIRRSRAGQCIVHASAGLAEFLPSPLQLSRRGARRRGARCARILALLRIRDTIDRMRTTLDLPDGLAEEAVRLLGFKSKTDAVVVSLQELIRRRRVNELKELLGHVDLEIDVGKARRRPRS